MNQELGLLCVLLLPVALIYFYRSNALEPNNSNSDAAGVESASKKSKKKKKKGKSKKSGPTSPATTATPINNESTTIIDNEKQSDVKAPSKNRNVNVEEQPDQSATRSKKSNKQKAKKGSDKKPEHTVTTTGKEEGSSTTLTTPTPSIATSTTNTTNVKESREVDEHMDLTARYSRVMRITTEPEEEEWEPVPREDGWESIGTSRKPIYSAPRTQETLTKKQRENQAKAAKRKQAKANSDTLQAERLRRHQKELERQKINEFYSTGAGKNTPWGKKPQRGSSKVPQATASLNEKGQLIWD